MVTTKFQPAIVFLLPVFPEKPRTGGEIYNRQVIDRLVRMNFLIRVVSLDSVLPVEKLHQPEFAGEVRKALLRQFDVIAEEFSQGSYKPVLVYDSWLYRFLWPVMVQERFRRRFRLISFSQLCYWDTYRSMPSRVWHRLLTFLALAPAHRRIGVSRSLLNADLGVLRSQIRDLVIYPGCDFADSALKAADCCKMPAQIISIGNYTPRKGFHILIEALAMLFKDRPELRNRLQLILVGNRSFNPEYLNRLEKTIGENGLGCSVVLEDWKSRDEVSQLFSASQLFAFASDSEGFGMVVLEAMLHGLPVLLGDFMTARELIGDAADCGFVVPRSSPAAFAQAISAYFDLDDRARMGLQARERAKKMKKSWDEVAADFAALLQPRDRL